MMNYILSTLLFLTLLSGYSQDNTKRYYVVVQSFKNEVLAKQFQQEMKQKGYDAAILYNAERAFYYIYFEEIKTLQTAAKEKDILRSSGFENAWVYVK